MKKNLAAAIGVLLAMCYSGAPLHAQEEMLAPRGTFKPSVSLSETYTEFPVLVTAEDGTSSHQVGSVTSLSVSIKASMRGVSLSTPVEDTPVSVSFGGFFHEGTLGEAVRDRISGKRGKVSERAIFTLSEDDEDPASPRATVTYTWDERTLTIRISSDIGAFGEDYSGEDSGRFTDSDSVNVEFGTGSGEGDLKIVGKVKTRRETAGTQQLDLSVVNLSARLKPPVRLKPLKHTFQGGSVTTMASDWSFPGAVGWVSIVGYESREETTIGWENRLPVDSTDALLLNQLLPPAPADTETSSGSDTSQGTLEIGTGSILSPGASAATLTIHQPHDVGWDRTLWIGRLYVNSSAEIVLPEAPAVYTEVSLENANLVPASWATGDPRLALLWAKYNGFHEPAVESPSPAADSLSSLPVTLDFGTTRGIVIFGNNPLDQPYFTWPQTPDASAATLEE
jgi:hypothetical protein